METEVTSTSDQNGEQDEELSMDKEQSLDSPIFVISEVCTLNTKEQSIVSEQSLQLAETDDCQTSDTCSATEDDFCDDIVLEEEPCTEMYQSTDMHTFVISDTIDQVIPSDDGFIVDSTDPSEYVLLHPETSSCRKTCDSCSETEDEFYDCRICGEGYSEMNDLMAHTLTHDEQSLGCNIFEETGQEKSEVLFGASTYTDYHGSEKVDDDVIDLTDDGHIDVHEEMLLRDSGNNVSLVAPATENPLSHSTVPHLGHKAKNYSTIGRIKCTVCGICLKSRSTLSRHIALHKDPGGFKCIHCGKVITRKDNLKVHLALQKGKGPFKCSVCGDVFAQRCAMKVHKALHSEKQPTKDSGGQRADHTGDLYYQQDHQAKERNYTNINQFECTVCGKCLKSKETLRQHMKIHSERKAYRCSYCGKRFSQSASLCHHMAIHKRIGSFKCIHCGTTFSKKRYLTRHMARESGKGPVKCNACGEIFVQKCALRIHMTLHSEEQPNKDTSGQGTVNTGTADTEDLNSQLILHVRSPYECNMCGESFEQESSLNMHITEHNDLLKPGNSSHMFEHIENSLATVESEHISDEQSLSCFVCGKVFKTHWGVRRHMEVHKEGKPHRCSICGKQFKWHGNMLAHKKRHVQVMENSLTTPQQSPECEENLYQCDVCGKYFREMKLKKIHMAKLHTARPYRCEICGQAFSNKRQCVNHDLVVHSEDVTDEEKPFKCTECGRLFRFSHHRSLHMAVHTGEKPYECEICGRGFVGNFLLQNHMAVHSDAKPFECVVCRKGCKTKSALTSHIRSHTVKQTHT